MNKFTSTPNKSLDSQSKDTNICAFLKTVPNLKALSRQSVLKLAERFTISPESFSLLISIASNGGAYYEN